MNQIDTFLTDRAIEKMNVHQPVGVSIYKIVLTNDI